MKELILYFPNENQVIVEYSSDRAAPIKFESPLTDEDRYDICWYIEVYGTQYTINFDDERADRIVGELKGWGESLFNKVFGNDYTKKIFLSFFSMLDKSGGLITIDANAPSILSLPWEILCFEGKYLAHEYPSISVRRRLTDSGVIKRQFLPKSKNALHLLFVVSRPRESNFIDPRSESMAVMDALDRNARGRVTVEFLRPPTLWNLEKRLKLLEEYTGRPAVDIIHFDGHGIFDTNQKIGSLLFEKRSGAMHLVNAEVFGQLLSEYKVSLVVLSACQSAKMNKADPLSSVSALLNHFGVPAVIAMGYSVLMNTTLEFFGLFYNKLCSGMGIAAAFKFAQHYLYVNPKRENRHRGINCFIFNLYDWFSPTLYQYEKDIPLLSRATKDEDRMQGERLGKNNRFDQRNLSICCFHGRARELWLIERLFLSGVRRITIHGFSGQGKTELAAETGRWLTRTGMFKKYCLIDYSLCKNIDPVTFAINSISVSFHESVSCFEASKKIIEKCPTLLILDSLDNLQNKEADFQSALLDAASIWSQAGESRVLITTRQTRLYHSEYGQSMNPAHRYLHLEGLEENDALGLFSTLWEKPPATEFPKIKPQELIEIFKKIDFHPLAISQLTSQLKRQRTVGIENFIENMLSGTTDEEAKNNFHISYEMSLERLSEKYWSLMPRMGVFQSGAMENLLVEIAEFPNWKEMRQELEVAGLIWSEKLPDIKSSYLKFHPTLASHFWMHLSSSEKKSIIDRHRKKYYWLCNILYKHELYQDENDNIAIALRELPNLLFAVKNALTVVDKNAVDFVICICYFLNNFGLLEEKDHLIGQAETIVEVATDEWGRLQCDRVKTLLISLRFSEAEKMLRNLLSIPALTNTHSQYFALNLLCTLLCATNRYKEAKKMLFKAYDVAKVLKLAYSENFFRDFDIIFGDILTGLGKIDEARYKYNQALSYVKNGIDNNKIAEIECGLASLCLSETPTAAFFDEHNTAVDKLAEAERHYHKAIHIFKKLSNPVGEAVVQNNLGIILKKRKKWDSAEIAYRESARLWEKIGNQSAVVNTYIELASVIEGLNRWKEAEIWYRKALELIRQVGDQSKEVNIMISLADLILKDPNRLQEAYQLSNEALSTMKKLRSIDKIYMVSIYGTLKNIAEQQIKNRNLSIFQRIVLKIKSSIYGWIVLKRTYSHFNENLICDVYYTGPFDKFFSITIRIIKQLLTDILLKPIVIVLGGVGGLIAGIITLILGIVISPFYYCYKAFQKVFNYFRRRCSEED
ncbi:MAG: CHAT domain-containing protein [Desulfococcaceae bacterium]